MLAALDENNDGWINIAQLKRGLTELVLPSASADDVAATVDFVNVHGEAFVDLHEVVRDVLSVATGFPLLPRIVGNMMRRHVPSVRHCRGTSCAAECADYRIGEAHSCVWWWC